MTPSNPIFRPALALVLALALATFSVPATAVAGDDTQIFSTTVPPNVLLFIDNSGSMNAIMEHPAFDRSQHPFDRADGSGVCDIVPPSASNAWIQDDNGDWIVRRCFGVGCTLQVDVGTPGFTYTADPSDHPDNGYVTRTFCGETRKLYHDGSLEDDNNNTWYFEEYLEWYFSLDSSDPVDQQILSEIDDDTNGRHFISGDYFSLYKRSRITAAREIARDVIYQTNTDCPAFAGDCGVYHDRVRFGIGQFHRSAHGGFVRADIDKYSANRLALENAIDALDAQTSTPLGESLFKIYTYFMSRTTGDRPKGKDGTTEFPEYSYNRWNGDYTTTNSYIPPDPVDVPCQRNFVIMLTDGEPTRDRFELSGSTTLGFDDFRTKLIGDFGPDDSTIPDADYDFSDPTSPEEGSPPWNDSTGAGYLDDVAHFMQQNDLRPDMADTPRTQVVDLYTVGFGTFGPVSRLLEKAARNGNGDFFEGNQAADLTDALIQSIQDIIVKSQGFAAATVPAARTSQGGQLYTSLFLPSNKSAFWRGFLRSFRITANGEILDDRDFCAVDDTTSGTCVNCAAGDPHNGECKSGPFKATAQPFWDAALEMPVPDQRDLRVSKLVGATPAPGMVSFDQSTVGATELGLAAGDVALYPPDPDVTDAASLAKAVVAHAAGCDFGTGVANYPSDCSQREFVNVNGQPVAARLGDIFHSNPIVVGPPRAFLSHANYGQFACALQDRERMILAGANDGFLHAFHAGGNTASSGQPVVYDAGTGREEWAFMPWAARQKIKVLARTAGAHAYFVDGSPAAADVLLKGNAISVPNGCNGGGPPVSTEWHTVLVGGMRQGGRHYYALDVTDPSSGSYPEYMWEFPREDDPHGAQPFFGETWSEPIIARIRVKTGASTWEARWVAVVGLGYDAASDPNDSSYLAGAQAGRGIAMIDLATGEPIAALTGGTAANQVPGMLYAMPSTPAVIDWNQDGFADLVFIGDLGGNVWKWVIKDPAEDAVADPSKLHQPGWTLKKFFQADPAVPSHFRSFFFPPSATRINGKLYLAFGSGERADLLYQGAAGPADNNRFYVAIDRDPFELLSVPLATVIGDAPANAGDMTDLTAFQDQCPATLPAGFFFTVGDGEKFTTNSEIFGGFVFVSTFTPQAAAANQCGAGGTSKLYGFLAQCGQGFFGNASTSAGPTNPKAKDKRTKDLSSGFSTDPRLSISPDKGGNRLIISKQDGTLINVEGPGQDQQHGQLYWRELVD